MCFLVGVSELGETTEGYEQGGDAMSMSLGQEDECVSDTGNGSKVLQTGDRGNLSGETGKGLFGAWTMAVCYS